MSVRFADFELDPVQRTLMRSGVPVDLNARYFDALAVLAGAPGELVTKDRFMDEVWRGIPVTDEALTQCIRTLRRQLGDDAANPRFIETVPKHGYRFIAPVEHDSPAHAVAAIPDTAANAASRWPRVLLLAGMGTMGGGVAGLFGGLVYGLLATAQPATGAASVLLVVLCLTLAVALVGAGAVSFAVASADLAPDRRWFWRVLAGAIGGFVIGAVVKLLGSDALNLLFGAAPSRITGGGEGAVLGAATGLGCWLAMRGDPTRPIAPRAGLAALIGGVAGAGIALAGGQLMSGSLGSLARQFPASRLRLDPIGAFMGEQGLGIIGQSLSSAMEGALFTGCIAAAMALALRSKAAR
ncbi:winged helix-turn-helix domain-containing protein [Sphingomonas turrisvirgatae]|uniref:OmpR/PhoB-type domain-containing protein n=1 Tax=Sphingomonas turrisvirgatae TaxID=1888892 RepID=A0A1E3LWY8_9SPHN|nr:transcriptional regulator [Sphingomonas turrisvirgatae]ODP37320.1 hypothetical protein BFL28_18575 [Sphingomonas turrisvirgatae]